MRKGKEIAEAALGVILFTGGAEAVIAEEQVVSAELPMVAQVTGEVVQPSAINTFMAYNPGDELGLLGVTAPSSSHVGPVELDKVAKTSDNVTTAVPTKTSVPVNTSASFRPGQPQRERFPVDRGKRVDHQVTDRSPRHGVRAANK